MTSGTSRLPASRILLAWLAVFPVAGWAAGFTPGELERLLRAAAAPIRVAYTEEQTLAALDIPMISSGRLSFRPPDALRKDVLSPVKASYLIEGDRLIIIEGDARREMALDDFPPLRALAEGLRSTLAGDFQTLRRHYRLEVSGAEDAWRLHLLPGDETLGRFIDHILVRGSGSRLVAIEVVERNGDRSLTRIASP